jgi:hypothetical protein
VVAAEYFDLIGAWPSRYRFFVLSDTGGTLYTIALSSSMAANTNATEMLGHATRKWIFHLDLENGNAISTLKVFEGEPDYDTVKPLVIEEVRKQEATAKP